MKTDALDTNRLLLDILDFDPDRRRANHFLKVTAYADAIAGLMDMPARQRSTLHAAALLHDIGIKPSLEKYQSSAGDRQQAEGPPIARGMLEQYGCDREFVDRVCYLIAHHHEYSNIDGDDCQVLVEADFLVNCDEGGMDRETVLSIRNSVFRTAPGTDLLNRLFRLEVEAAP